MFSMNKSKSNMNIDKRKNSAALSVKKGSIDFFCIDNCRLKFISTDANICRLLYDPWRFLEFFMTVKMYAILKCQFCDCLLKTGNSYLKMAWVKKQFEMLV